MTQGGEVYFGLPLSRVPDVHDLIVSGELEKALELCSEGAGDRALDGVRGDGLSQKIPIPPYFRKSKTWSGHRIRKRMKFQGLDISIENPAGTYRQGIDVDGKPWRSLLHFDYGYIRGTTSGGDGDHVDCFIGPYKDSTRVFVIHQKDVKTGKYDEDKVMLGWRTKKAAIRDYLKNYNRSDQVMGTTTMAMATFKTKAAATKKKPMMIKAVVRAHPRRVKSGKVVQIRQHQTRRAKRKDVGFRYVSGDFGTERTLEMYRLSDGTVLMQIDPFGGGIPVDPKRRAARLKKMAQELWTYYEKVHGRNV